MSYPATFPNRAMPVPFRPSMGSKGTGDAMGRAAGTRAGRPGRSGAHTCPFESRGAHLGPTRAPRAGRVAGLQAPAFFLPFSRLVRARAAAAAAPGFIVALQKKKSKPFSACLCRPPDSGRFFCVRCGARTATREALLPWRENISPCVRHYGGTRVGAGGARAASLVGAERASRPYT